MESYITKGYIPLDKSWMNRMGVLDLLNGYDDTIRFLKKQKGLGKDLQALYQASIDWKDGEKQIHIGESGTLYRFLKFASWKLGLEKEFILEGTLRSREVCDDPKIIDYPLEELLKLDGGTSQWASASVLLGNDSMAENPPFKLKVTYEAVKHWKESRAQGKCWEPRYDETILKQASAYSGILRGEHNFEPEQAEDYCFAAAFGFMTRYQGEKRWPQLKNHESDRLETIQEALISYYDNDIKTKIDSDDHRVVQAMAMLIRSQHRDMSIKEIKAMFSNPGCVDKSWSRFWDFLKDIK